MNLLTSTPDETSSKESEEDPAAATNFKACRMEFFQSFCVLSYADLSLLSAADTCRDCADCSLEFSTPS